MVSHSKFKQPVIVPTGICLSRGWTFFTSLRKRQRHTNHQDFGFPPEQKALHNKRKGIATPTLLVDRPCRPHHPHRHRCQTDSQAEGGHSFHRLFCQRLAGLPKLDSTLLLRPRDHFLAEHILRMRVEFGRGPNGRRCLPCAFIACHQKPRSPRVNLERDAFRNGRPSEMGGLASSSVPFFRYVASRKGTYLPHSGHSKKPASVAVAICLLEIMTNVPVGMITTVRGVFSVAFS
eukprot:scaffold578_cov243-Pinguiococcus_pyrenoidosus.AAC.11